MTFGTGDGAPDPGVKAEFRRHAVALATTVPLEMQREFAELDHDMSSGSDGILMIDGLIGQAAAEVFAVERLLSVDLAALTAFHHARALYEAHTVAHWTLQSFGDRWPRVIKERQIERQRFETAASTSIGPVATDITAEGKSLIEAADVKRLPSTFDMTRGNPILEFDHAFLWKYASSHLHPGNIYRARVSSGNQRSMIHQIMYGSIRNAAGTYHAIAAAFHLPLAESMLELEAAEAFSAPPMRTLRKR